MARQPLSIDLNKQLGANVQRFRKLGGLSQANLAERLEDRGFSFQQPMVGKVERGERPLKADELVAIAEILDVDAAMLLDYYSPAAEAAAASAQLQNATAGIAGIDRQIAELERERQHYDILRREAERRLADVGVVRGDR